ncbi:hypothetical protein FJV41_14615 [Myxococcus llanfairpwllgwyngyllgogerychwyrndrobwllllantysiliogogogochensis]|uniref:Uncharacterized protein n=1 Tax=Myxococcus llanfairpwllgwyngyllgogerychwyrndrobwllllantysiliogogogochensis TaxID=2590453 RepID=A0A540X1Y1_9BACT|nr:hypothetical protein [Myxococcus llanfairpwllgwyngyllgogerychwyrndrobwllllantysiliogogogochensis]TQF15223.1 hypothetical protein FJV41_14615 [Myxococcus llanfairpwllgwyngyllgogerychwyrndrobwllllantysiliogogogochensis]
MRADELVQGGVAVDRRRVRSIAVRGVELAARTRGLLPSVEGGFEHTFPSRKEAEHMRVAVEPGAKASLRRVR